MSEKLGVAWIKGFSVGSNPTIGFFRGRVTDDESECAPDDTPVAEIKASLNRALQQVKTVETRPISKLWDRIDK